MTKGFVASVAALATSAGIAWGQGSPGTSSAAPQNFPGYGFAVAGAPAALAPAGMGQPQSGGTPVPPAGPADVPHSGVQQRGGTYDPWAHDSSYDPEGAYAGHGGNGQLHKAAGGPDRWWIDLELLRWEAKSGPINFPLATASPLASAGIVGRNDTRILYGNNNVDWGAPFHVFRLTLGYWDAQRVWGVDLSGFIQEAKTEISNFAAPVTTREVLARPVIDAITGQQSAVLIASPGAFAGELQIRSQLKLGGAEANIRRALIYCDRLKLNLLGGIRYIDHDENVSLVSRTSVPNPFDPLVAPDLVDIFDEFACRNQFFGAQLGFQGEWRHGRWFSDVTGKLALGNMNQQQVVTGFTNTQIVGIDTNTSGGVLALDSNIGKRNRDDFAYVPELTIKLGYQLTQRISTYIGYNMLYMSRVLRPGDQMDPVVNPTYIPVSAQYGNFFGPVRPAQAANVSDFWVQGVTFGYSIRY